MTKVLPSESHTAIPFNLAAVLKYYILDCNVCAIQRPYHTVESQDINVAEKSLRCRKS